MNVHVGLLHYPGPTGPMQRLLGSINVITKATYHSNSYNSSNAVILVYSTLLQLCLFFSLLRFSLLTTVCSQLLTHFYFLWVFVVTRCGSCCTCCGSCCTCCSSAILLTVTLFSAYKLFNTILQIVHSLNS